MESNFYFPWIVNYLMQTTVFLSGHLIAELAWTCKNSHIFFAVRWICGKANLEKLINKNICYWLSVMGETIRTSVLLIGDSEAGQLGFAEASI